MATHPIRQFRIRPDRPGGPRRVRRTRRAERGASLVEYALLVALIALACLGAVTSFGGATNNSLKNSTSMIVSAGP